MVSSLMFNLFLSCFTIFILAAVSLASRTIYVYGKGQATILRLEIKNITALKYSG